MTLRTELSHEMREAAADVLVPAVHELTRTAAVAAVVRAPATIDRVAPVAVAGSAAVGLAAVTAARHARARVGRRLALPVAAGRRRRPAAVREQVDVAVDARTASARFARFQEDHRGAVIVEEVPAARVVWRRDGTLGRATFHRLGATMTRLDVCIDPRPRLLPSAVPSRRALRAELLRFRAATALVPRLYGRRASTA